MVKELYTGSGARPDKEILAGAAPATEKLIEAQRDPAGYKMDKGAEQARVRRAVNMALALHLPLLISGEPGSGKTQLGYAVANELGKPPPFKFNVKSQSVARDLFYDYDAVSHFRAGQSKDRLSKPARAGGDEPDGADARDFVEYAALGLAILLALPWAAREPFLGAHYRRTEGVSPERKALNELLLAAEPRQMVVVIDEIDKAPPDFPNDLLHELENMSFRAPELRLESGPLAPDRRPIIFITSNSERQLPEAFLRRCAFIHLKSPEGEALQTILTTRLHGMYAAGAPLLDDIQAFYEAVRKTGGYSKPPGTAELIQFLMAAQIEGGDVSKGIAEQRQVIKAAVPLLGKSDMDTQRLLRALDEWRSPTPAPPAAVTVDLDAARWPAELPVDTRSVPR